MHLTINGFGAEVRYTDLAEREILLPLLHRLTALKRRIDHRAICFLAAPPGAGKSTLAAYLEALSRAQPDCLPVQALGLDGFHHTNAWLKSHFIPRDGGNLPLIQIKGAPETYDVEALADALARARRGDVRWPFYDRRLHDPVPDATPVTADILIVEGNWLLLDAPPWRELTCDLSVFIAAGEAQLRDRLIARKIRGGLDPEAARAFYEASDGPNVRRCLAESRPADVRLVLAGDGDLRYAESPYCSK